MAFRRYDVDGNGFLDIYEFMAVRDPWGSQTSSQLKKPWLVLARTFSQHSNIICKFPTFVLFWNIFSHVPKSEKMTQFSIPLFPSCLFAL